MLLCSWGCSTRHSGRRNASHILALLISVYLLAAHAITPSQAQIGNCSRLNPDVPSSCVEGETYLDSGTGCCERCNPCRAHSEMIVISQCTLTEDSQCGCDQPLFLSSGTCYIDCRACPILPGSDIGECVVGYPRCKCLKPECYEDHDFYCRHDICPPPSPPPTPRNGSTITTTVTTVFILDSNSLPSWGFGLIAIGIVIGIIIFASCFLCMGLSTLRGKRSFSPDGSENSENGLVGGSVVSIGTNSSYLPSTMTGPGYPYLSSHNMLELLKNSNSQLVLMQNGSLSSIQNCSPSSGSKKYSPYRHKEEVSSLQSSSPLSVRAHSNKSPSAGGKIDNSVGISAIV